MKPAPHFRLTPRRVPLLALCFALGCKSGSEPAPSGAEPAAEAPQAVNTPGAAEPVSADPVSPTPALPARAPARPLNVLLLTIDSMRGKMPWTGYERDIAPNLTALAKRSVVYPRAYSSSSHTGKSVSALFTGRYPSSVYRSGYFFATFPDSNLFFTEILQQRGIRTLGGHGHAYFDRGKQLNQGFDVWKLVDGIDFDSETDRHVTSHKMTDLAIEMLSDPKNTSGQFFLWFHYMDPHDQYIQHADVPVFGKKARDRYDAEIFYTDRHIGRLFEFGEQQSWWKDTAIIISADHGEAFGEHGMYKHSFELWEVITHVPLVVYAPGIEPRHIGQRRSHIDLAPTILDLMGIKPETTEAKDSFAGRSLVSELYGAEPDVREPIVLDLPEDFNNPERKAIIQDDIKLIVRGDGRALLFDLSKDPGEENDLAKQNPELLKQMRERFDETWKGIDVVAPYGGMKLRSGKRADGPQGPEKAPEKPSTTP